MIRAINRTTLSSSLKSRSFFVWSGKQNLARQKWNRHMSSSSYDFLKESLRWKQRIATSITRDDDDDATTTTRKKLLRPIPASEWKDYIDHLVPEEDREWMRKQPPGVIETLSHHRKISSETTTTDTDTTNEDDDNNDSQIPLLRQPKDAVRSDEGLLPPCQQWSALAKYKSKYAYQVVDTGRGENERKQAFLSYLSSCYSYDRYKSTVTTRSASDVDHADNTDDNDDEEPLVKVAFHTNSDPDEEKTDLHAEEALISALYWAQDLISTPANDLTPTILQHAVEQWVNAVTSSTTVASSEEDRNRITMETIIGDDLLQYNGTPPSTLSTSFGCGMIHAVGQASKSHPPRLIRLSYQPSLSAAMFYDKTARKEAEKRQKHHIALVGKGVTYDTGGLNLKPGTGMRHMKKDMGGAALALGLFRALAECNFPIRIDCWVPVVENVVSHDSYRPGDILQGVSGKTTEIGNTDAEGRLILADALTLAGATNPSLMIDFATLTGAQRVALGLDLPAVMGNPAAAPFLPPLFEAAREERDPLWQLPLWMGYRDKLKSPLADLQNIGSDGLGGAITAALYLNEFVKEDIPWLHIDFNGLDNSTGLGRAQTLRAMNRFLWNTCGPAK